MPNHPNRSGNSAARNPTAAEVAALRASSGLDLRAFGAIVYCTPTYISRVESGDARMHPATFELLRIKLQGRGNGR